MRTFAIASKISCSIVLELGYIYLAMSIFGCKRECIVVVYVALVHIRPHHPDQHFARVRVAVGCGGHEVGVTESVSFVCIETALVMK